VIAEGTGDLDDMWVDVCSDGGHHDIARKIFPVPVEIVRL